MDALSAAKFEEHEPHGWRVEMPLYAVLSMKKVDGYWMACSCGWHGWIPDDPERQPVENYHHK